MANYHLMRQKSKSWYTLYIDLVEEYRMTLKKKTKLCNIKVRGEKYFYLQANIIIDLATNWIEIHSVVEARADLVANLVELTWPTKYTQHDEINVNKDI